MGEVLCYIRMGHKTYLLWSPCHSRLQGHEHGVVRQGHEELVGVYLRAVLLADQGQRHCRQGQQQSLADLQHTCRLLWINVGMGLNTRPA